jgi:hypothetical protein
MASFAVVETTSFIVRQAMDIEKIFRDIDTNGRRNHLFRASACHPGL